MSDPYQETHKIASRPGASWSLLLNVPWLVFCALKPGVEDDRTRFGLRLSNVMESANYARFPSFDDHPGSRKWNLQGYIDGQLYG